MITSAMKKGEAPRNTSWALIGKRESCATPATTKQFNPMGVRDDLAVQDVFRGVMPFFIADAATIALLVAFPGIVLWLPSLAG